MQILLQTWTHNIINIKPLNGFLKELLLGENCSTI